MARNLWKWGRMGGVLVLLAGHAYEKPTSIAFTAAYSDSDDASGQQTLVATSQLKWGVPASFGVLSFVEGGRRHYPPLEEALKGGNLQIEIRRLKGDNLFDKE
ncbi:hypothetical protein F0U60_12620 [Archangium minus]|uniref:Uncharacterized protein n=1 Tax=Archangium minus TaxID=83450 RepID=A0ABY9WT22_9BACT|nr:hypothetical protein F0U60_12620 [Archangium minus]